MKSFIKKPVTWVKIWYPGIIGIFLIVRPADNESESKGE